MFSSTRFHRHFAAFIFFSTYATVAMYTCMTFTHNVREIIRQKDARSAVVSVSLATREHVNSMFTIIDSRLES